MDSIEEYALSYAIYRVLVDAWGELDEKSAQYFHPSIDKRSSLSVI